MQFSRDFWSSPDRRQTDKRHAESNADEPTVHRWAQQTDGQMDNIIPLFPDRKR